MECSLGYSLQDPSSVRVKQRSRDDCLSLPNHNRSHSNSPNRGKAQVLSPREANTGYSPRSSRQNEVPKLSGLNTGPTIPSTSPTIETYRSCGSQSNLPPLPPTNTCRSSIRNSTNCDGSPLVTRASSTRLSNQLQASASVMGLSAHPRRASRTLSVDEQPVKSKTSPTPDSNLSSMRLALPSPVNNSLDPQLIRAVLASNSALRSPNGSPGNTPRTTLPNSSTISSPILNQFNHSPAKSNHSTRRINPDTLDVSPRHLNDSYLSPVTQLSRRFSSGTTTNGNTSGNSGNSGNNSSQLPSSPQQQQQQQQQQRSKLQLHAQEPSRPSKKPQESEEDPDAVDRKQLLKASRVLSSHVNNIKAINDMTQEEVERLIVSEVTQRYSHDDYDEREIWFDISPQSFDRASQCFAPKTFFSKNATTEEILDRFKQNTADFDRYQLKYTDWLMNHFKYKCTIMVPATLPGIPTTPRTPKPSFHLQPVENPSQIRQQSPVDRDSFGESSPVPTTPRENTPKGNTSNAPTPKASPPTVHTPRTNTEAEASRSNGNSNNLVPNNYNAGNIDNAKSVSRQVTQNRSINSYQTQQQQQLQQFQQQQQQYQQQQMLYQQQQQMQQQQMLYQQQQHMQQQRQQQQYDNQHDQQQRQQSQNARVEFR